jgi:Flp pilus assembly protein TadG
MSIGLVVLLLVVVGLLDLGRLWYVFVAIEDGAGEAALYIATNPDCPQDDGDPANGVCDDPNNALWRAQHAGGELVDWSSSTVAFSPAPPYQQGDTISATIAYRFDLLTPIIPDIAGARALTLTAHASQIISGE